MAFYSWNETAGKMGEGILIEADEYFANQNFSYKKINQKVQKSSF
jgi:hypothetical protein